MQRAFSKMHGAGNDFAVFDAREQPLALSPAVIAALADRHAGIGFDQLVVIGRGDAEADAGVRFYNADGSESGACGNATRCVAWLVAGGVPGTGLALRSGAGLLSARLLDAGLVEVGMGSPALDWRRVPLAHAADTLHLPLDGDPAACSMGNPHATWFDGAVDPALRGEALASDPLFPEGANIGFATILGPDRMRLVVYERGSGLTLACGSGACAAVVNAARRGLTGRRVQVEMPGGTLEVAWDEADRVHLTGPVAHVFAGSVSLP